MVDSENAYDPLPTYKKAALQTIANKKIRETTNWVLGQFSLNTMQWILLGILYESTTGLRITDIAASLQVEVPMITNLAQPLIAVGFVRNRVSRTDRRSRPLALTPHGKEIVLDIEAELTEHLKSLENGLSRQQLDDYFQALQTFISNADQDI